MNGASPEEVKAFLAQQFADELAATGRAGELPDDFDLLIEGVMDSLGLLELVSALEQRFGVALDLEELDAEDLTKVGPIARVVAAQSVAASG